MLLELFRVYCKIKMFVISLLFEYGIIFCFPYLWNSDIEYVKILGKRKWWATNIVRWCEYDLMDMSIYLSKYYAYAPVIGYRADSRLVEFVLLSDSKLRYRDKTISPLFGTLSPEVF